MKIGINCLLTADAINPTELGKAIEERGFDSLSVAEHTNLPAGKEIHYTFGGGDIPRYVAQIVDPYLALMAAGTATSRIKLMTAVSLLPLHETILLSKTAATLDMYSNGRFILGVGAGWIQDSMENHGIDFTSRTARFEEQLQAVRAIMNQEHPEFHGTHVDFGPMEVGPQRPKMPIYVGGESTAALRRAAQYGDGYLAPPFPPEMLGSRIEKLWSMSDRRLPVIVTGGSDDPKTLEAYAELGVDSVEIILTPMVESISLPRDVALDRLDKLTPFISEFA